MLKRIDRFLIKYTYQVFLLTLIFWIGFLPLFEITGQVHFLEFLITCFLIISAMYFFYRSKKKFHSYALGPATLLFVCMNYFLDDYNWVSQIDRVLLFIFMLMTTAHLIGKVIRQREVDLEVIVISIAAYIMIGLMSSIMCWFTYNLYPGAYNIQFDSYGPILDFTYYSIVTMSTLGYGDITPQIAQSRALAMVITLVGQFYMTILMAFLIGKFLNQRN